MTGYALMIFGTVGQVLAADHFASLDVAKRQHDEWIEKFKDQDPIAICYRGEQIILDG